MKSKIYFLIVISALSFMFPYNSFSQNNNYEVFALKFASRNEMIPISSIAVGSTSRDSIGVCNMFWLIRENDARIILVDAGFTDSLYIKDLKYTRPDKILLNIGIKPKDVTDIIITHPHWDHIGGIDLFPKAMIWMQKDDYDYFVGSAWQTNGNTNGFNQKDVIKIVQKNLDKKLTLVKGDDIEIIPGIKVYIGSKHTYESQFILVNTKSDKVIIASDNCWYYYNLINLLPIPVGFDPKAYIQNLKRMKKMVKNLDLIIPGHDPLVFSKFPEVTENIVKISD
ncbi:MAG TPA: N-acyl homoserine lactonase family protein [Saprospiraceae bacterium]|nr:N-acyl homoserine lactonase family protein [Saprospiraceae bacterium]